MNKTQTITLPDSGREVEIMRPEISPTMLYIQLQQTYPRPTPPKQEVRIMGKLEWVENIAHPDYAKEVEAWNSKISLVNTDKIITFGVVSEPDDDDLVQVNKIRGMLGNLVTDLTDVEVFIKFVLVKSQEDFRVLSDAIGALTMPTEGQIANHAERFQRAS